MDPGRAPTSGRFCSPRRSGPCISSSSIPGFAVYCAKAGRDAALDPARAAVLAASTVALGFLVWLFLGSWRRRRPSATDADFSFEGNTPEERHRFLTHMSLASSALSIVAVIYTTIPILVLETCR